MSDDRKTAIRNAIAWALVVGIGAAFWLVVVLAVRAV